MQTIIYKRFALFAVTSLLAAAAQAQTTTLFTTTNDFSGWTAGGSFTGAPVTSPDQDGSTINGIGNTTAAGSAGTVGSLSLQWLSGTYVTAVSSPGEQNNAAFITALENASTLTFDYTTPPAGTGSYFQLLFVLNYQGNYSTISGSTASLGNGWTQETINFSSSAATMIAKQAANGGSFSYFQVGILYNSNYTPTGTPFNVDNIQVIQAAPEPATATLLGLGCLGMITAFRRRNK